MVQISKSKALIRRRNSAIECTAHEQGRGHNALVLADWFHLKLLDLDGSGKVTVDGHSLNIAAVAAVARYVFSSKS
jgi:hypothetical protein